MKHDVRRFKSMEICLKELEPFIRDGMHLQSGKPFKKKWTECARARQWPTGCCARWSSNSLIWPKMPEISSIPESDHFQNRMQQGDGSLGSFGGL